jgi:hypothetical protein
MSSIYKNNNRHKLFTSKNETENFLAYIFAYWSILDSIFNEIEFEVYKEPHNT